jgi:hypothetical protein
MSGLTAIRQLFAQLSKPGNGSLSSHVILRRLPDLARLKGLPPSHGTPRAAVFLR